MTADTITSIRASALDLTKASALASTAATRLKLANDAEPLPAGFIDLAADILAAEQALARLAYRLGMLDGRREERAEGGR